MLVHTTIYYCVRTDILKHQWAVSSSSWNKGYRLIYWTIAMFAQSLVKSIQQSSRISVPMNTTIMRATLYNANNNAELWKRMIPDSWIRRNHPYDHHSRVIVQQVEACLNGSVVERVTSNDKVHGSIPCWGTINSKLAIARIPFFYLLAFRLDLSSTISEN